MAKNRDERYSSTEDLLEDLRAVRAGQPPIHAKRAANLDTLEQLESKGKTVDIVPVPPRPSVWGHPVVLSLLGVIALLCISLIAAVVVAVSSH
jgi:hypothetical protein